MTDHTCPECGGPMRQHGVLMHLDNGRTRLVPFRNAEPYCPNSECAANDGGEEEA